MPNLTPEQLAAMVGEEAAGRLLGKTSTESSTGLTDPNTLSSVLGGLGLGETVLSGLPSGDSDDGSDRADGRYGLSPEIDGGNWNMATVVHENTTRLFNILQPHHDIPSLQEFIDAGVNFNKLHQGFEGYEAAGMKPELVFAPVNLPLQLWRDGYSALRQEQEVRHPLPPDGQPDRLPGRRLKEQPDGDGLWIWDGVANAWNDLNRQAVEDTPGTNLTVTNPDGTETVWKVLVVPTADKEEGGLAVNTSHDLSTASSTFSDQAETIGLTPESITQVSAHMPIGAHLTLQARRLHQDLPLLDQEGSIWTWNHGTFNDGGRAPAVYWYPGFGQVRVGDDGVDGSDGNVGVRAPVWG